LSCFDSTCCMSSDQYLTIIVSLWEEPLLWMAKPMQIGVWFIGQL
jgi:hypothetical protein